MAKGKHEGATREHVDGTGLSGGAKGRYLNLPVGTYWPRFEETIYALVIYIYIYILCRSWTKNCTDWTEYSCTQWEKIKFSYTYYLVLINLNNRYAMW